jgi:hypothetical protein
MKSMTLAVLAFATAITAFAQQSNPNTTDEKLRAADESYVTVAEEYSRKTERINELSRTMHLSENPADVKIEIENLQRDLLTLRDKAVSERRANTTTKKAALVTIYEFDETKSTLTLKDFDYTFEPVSGQLNVKFDSRAMGNAKVALVTPGKALLQQELLSNREGSYQGQFDLSQESLPNYFLHVEIDGKSTTKKIQLR